MGTAVSQLEVGLNVGGLLWIAALAALVAIAVYVFRRQRSGLQPVNSLVAVLAAAALLALTLGLAGLIVGAVLFAIFLLARLVE